MYDGVCSDPEVFGTFKAKMPRDEFEDFIGDWMFLSGMSSPFEYVLMLTSDVSIHWKPTALSSRKT